MKGLLYFNMNDILLELGHLAGATRFRRISEKLYLDGDKIYIEANVSFKASWFSVFYVLSKSEQAITVLEIANQIDFSHITVKNVLRELETEGLVIVKPNPSDKRSKLIVLSNKGKQLLKKLKPLWGNFSKVLQNVFEAGHPSLINILNRVDIEINKRPINKRIREEDKEVVSIVDYKPSLKKWFYELAGNWLLGVLDGELEEEDKFTLNNPDKAYLDEGGFVFFALYKTEVVGCVALKRLNEYQFEFAKLFINPNHRKLGIATKLIDRCIHRCVENKTKQLYLQTTLSMPEAHQLYYKLGFDDCEPSLDMKVLERTEKIMCKDL